MAINWTISNTFASSQNGNRRSPVFVISPITAHLSYVNVPTRKTNSSCSACTPHPRAARPFPSRPSSKKRPVLTSGSKRWFKRSASAYAIESCRVDSWLRPTSAAWIHPTTRAWKNAAGASWSIARAIIDAALASRMTRQPIGVVSAMG